ncbi:hypothetical protein JTB14_020860 [Gonioctena quinquepunctata]|nr:hypothetical protein JTB14_020860 [Gonioctena quinquepunctata]
METTRVINPTLLIEEVKKYPVLYDLRNSHSTQNIEQKRKAWEMVAANLCGERWDSYDEMEMDGVAKELQLKWKNLRDNFTRILRREKEEEATGTIVKRKKYVYFDQLKFLLPYTSFRKTTAATEDLKSIKEECEIGGRNAGNIIYINESRDSNDSDEENKYQSPTHFPKISTPSFPSIQAAPVATPTLTPIQLIQLQPTANGAPPIQGMDVDGVAHSGGKVAKVLDQLLQDRKEEKADDAMGNKKFLLSLLPFLKKMPDDVNLEVRLQIMNVVQSYSGNGFS